MKGMKTTDVFVVLSRLFGSSGLGGKRLVCLFVPRDKQFSCAATLLGIRYMWGHGRPMGRTFFLRASIVGFAFGGRDCSSAEEDDESGRLLWEMRDSLWIGVEKARCPYVTNFCSDGSHCTTGRSSNGATRN